MGKTGPRLMPPGLALMACLTGIAAAPAVALTPDFRTCLAKAQTEPANAACARAEAQRHETRLGAVWKALEARLGRKRDARHIALLREAQRLWLQWRDSHCAFAAGRAISGASKVYWRERCRARQTERRVLYLTIRLKAYSR